MSTLGRYLAPSTATNRGRRRLLGLLGAAVVAGLIGPLGRVSILAPALTRRSTRERPLAEADLYAPHDLAG